MQQEFYTDEEIELLLEQKRRANELARQMWQEAGLTMHPRIAEALAKKNSSE